MKPALELGWFSTGRGPGSRNLLNTIAAAIRRGEIDARIQYVFSNREPGEAEGSDQFFSLVKRLGLHLVCYSSRKFKRRWTEEWGPWRVAYDLEVIRRLASFSPHLCVLAGYMLIVGPRMCSRYTMINLHPAAPGGPEGTWQEVIWKLIGQGATQSGIKMHLVTDELDKGPTISFCTYPLRGGAFDPCWSAVSDKSVEELKAGKGEELPLFKLIRREGSRRELPLILETMKAVADGRARVDRAGLIESRDLTATIENAIS